MHNRLFRIMTVVVALSAVASASATSIDVSFVPPAQSVDIADGTASVDIVATVSGGGGLIGWGLDLQQTGTSVALADVLINETDFDAVAAFDGDDLAALVPIGSLPDGVYTLATLEFTLEELGLTTLVASYTETDPTEGFPLHPDVGGGFAQATFGTAAITVTPEPAALGLLTIALAVIRRR